MFGKIENDNSNAPIFYVVLSDLGIRINFFDTMCARTMYSNKIALKKKVEKKGT